MPPDPDEREEGLEVALSRRLVAVPHEDDERDDDCRQSQDDHENEDVETGHQLRTLRTEDEHRWILVVARAGRLRERRVSASTRA